LKAKIECRPKQLKSGEIGKVLPASHLEKQSELALILDIVFDRRRFGQLYWRLMPKYFDSMPPASGVFIGLNIPIVEFAAGLTFPGDVDMLVVPYHGNELILHKALAIEVKAIRARYEKQGKSPNKMGFSQANALLDAGFPYAALLHLIVSDVSPTRAWRKIQVAEVINDQQELGPFLDVYIDMMPTDLTTRAIERLGSVRDRDELGIGAAYTELSTITKIDNGLVSPPLPKQEYMPMAYQCGKNPKKAIAIMRGIAKAFERHCSKFIDVPRWDPA
jgi:hypothetical protein